VKQCIVCFAELNTTSWEPAQRANHINKCRSCIRKEKRDYAKVWSKNNPGAVTARSRKHKAKLALENPVLSRARNAYSDARKRAIKQNLPFDLTADYVHDLMRKATHCPYFQWALTHTPGKARTLASIDRIDSAKGYVKDNVQIVSYLANMMKSHATAQELVLFAAGVLRLRQ